jgi:transposase-like protein
VFGILEWEEIVPIEVVQDVSDKTLLTLAIKKVKRGSLIYADKFQGYTLWEKIWFLTIVKNKGPSYDVIVS